MKDGPRSDFKSPLLSLFVVASSSFVVEAGGRALLEVGVAFSAVVVKSSLSCVVGVVTVSSLLVIGGHSVVVRVSMMGGALVVVGASVVVVGVRGRSQALRQASCEWKIFGPLIGQKETLEVQERVSRL